MNEVMLLWHVGPDENNEKLIGAYRTESDANAAIERLRSRPGFRDMPDGFRLARYELNKGHWTEGFVVDDGD